MSEVGGIMWQRKTLDKKFDTSEVGRLFMRLYGEQKKKESDC